MKTEDSVLIEKFLDGSIAENESLILLGKLKNEEISINEVLELIKMHSLLYTEFHQDKNSEKLIEIVNRAIGEKKPGLSERVLRRIERKKKSNFNWAIAAVLFLSFLAGIAFYSNQLSHKPTHTTEVGETPISSNSVVNDTALMKTHQLPDGSIIELFPHSSMNIKSNLVVLEYGKLQANIKKQNKPLQFNAGDANCKIIGTKFILETAIQQNKPTTELIVTEGLVEMKAFNKKEMVKMNQRCIATSYDQNLILSDLQKVSDLNNIQNQNIIFLTNFEYKKLDKFWENWSLAEDQILKNSKKFTFVVKGENSNVLINSKVFKTYYKNIGYNFELMPTIIKGSMEISLTFSKKGVPYHQDGFILTNENNKIKIISYQVINGVKKEVDKGSHVALNSPFRFNGTISHLYTEETATGKKSVPVQDIDTDKFTVRKDVDIIEDVSIKIEAKSIGNSEGKVELLKAIIERLNENSKK